MLPAVIQHVWHKDRGMDNLAIYVASPEPIAATTYAPTSLELKQGDLVGFRIMMIRPPPAGLFGIPEVLLQPAYDVAEQAWLTERILYRG